MPPVKVHHTDTTDVAWDGAAQVAHLGDEYTKKDLRKVFAWLPDEADPKKSEAKFPHHQVDADGAPGAANVKACQSVIAILNGGMGGADIPDSDRQGVYDHVAAHLKDAGETPAELKSHTPPARTEPRTEPAPPQKETPVADLSERGAVRGVERRCTPFRGVQLRDKPDGTGGSTLHFEGYACVTDFGYPMQDWLGEFTELVRPGAFARTLNNNADVPFKINHEGLTLARTKSGTMRLAEDPTGLLVDADLDPASPHVQALRSAMDRGDVDEMSFAFWVTRQQWSPDWMQRDIIEVDIHKGDVSVVNYGANPATAGASLRGKALIDHLKLLTPRERRDVFDRLFAEFHPQADPPAPVLLADRAAMCRWAADRSRELREGKTLSQSTLDILGQVLDLIAAADDAVDQAQPMLADLMGVPNPDADDSDSDDSDDPDGDTPDDGNDDGGDDGQDGASAPQSNTLPLTAYQRRLRALELTA